MKAKNTLCLQMSCDRKTSEISKGGWFCCGLWTPLMEGKATFQLEDSEKRGNPSSYPSMGGPCVAPHSSRVQDFGGFWASGQPE